LPGRTISVASLLNELLLGWQKLRLYQPGHPERETGLVRAHTILTGLVAPTGHLSLGVSPSALMVGDEKLRDRSAARLAEALYRREVAVLRFEEGVELEELETLIHLLSAGGDGAPPLWEELETHGIEHVKAQPLELSGLLVAEDHEVTEEAAADHLLWDDLLKRLLADDRVADLGLGILPSGPASLSDVAQVVEGIMARLGSLADPSSPTAPGGSALSEADFLGALEQALSSAVGERLRPGPTGGRRASTRHVVELLAVLPEVLRRGVLDTALRSLLSTADAEPELREMASGVPAAQFVGALRRLRLERVAFSRRATALAESLIREAAQRWSEAAPRDPDETGDLSEELRSFFGEEDVDRYLLDSDRLFLELPKIGSAAAPEGLDERLETVTERRQLVSLGATLLDMLQRPVVELDTPAQVPERLEGVFRSLVTNGYLPEAVRLAEALESLAAGTYAAAEVQEQAKRCALRLRDPEIVAALVEALVTRDPTDRHLRHLIRLLGPPVVEGLLAALGDEQDLKRRRQLFDVLVRLGPTVVPHAVGLLRAERWYVRRNALALLREIGRGLDLAHLVRLWSDPDLRVRLEAIKAAPAFAVQISEGMLQQGIDDPSSMVAEATIRLVASHRLAAGRRPLLDLLNRPDPMGRYQRLRIKALAALGDVGDPQVLEELSPFFRRWFPSVDLEEQRAAFASLARYPEAARRALVERGLRFRDPEIRRTCRSLIQSAGANFDASEAAGS
jgi:HEAT repeat protein